MTAREMFEKIGYECRDDRERKKDLTFVPQDEPCICYEQTEGTGTEMIRFELDRHIIEFEATTTRFTKDPYRLPAPINMEELEAINQQVKELGWTE